MVEVYLSTWECYISCGENQGWEISPFVTKGTFPFPHSWLSSHSKKEFPHSWLRRSWGNHFSLFLLSHSWGKGNVPFVTHGEIFFPHSWLRHSWRKNPIPNSLHMRNRSFKKFAKKVSQTNTQFIPFQIKHFNFL